ncbi:MAG: nicotinate-nucleotide adenylyltransferase [Deltaproteobacteria bacterium]|nr:nicotinate-nucleotide adenylyltransferase [Deltaproteobacteria bacterium]
MATARSEGETRRRLGLFGGTFNPIHFGHLRSAEEVCEALSLDSLWFIPAAYPPHKVAQDLIPFQIRLEMARLAVGDHPVMAVSDLEGRRSGKSYSIETLRLVREELGPTWELYFILGLDAMLEIHTWKDYSQLFNLCHFVVLDRPGYDRSHLAEILTRGVEPQFQVLAGDAGFQHPSGYKVLWQETTLMDISATGIRRLVRQGRSIRYLLPEPVRGYIINHKLYL